MVEHATWLLLAAALSTVAGFAWLALAMDVHWRQVLGGEGPGAGARRLLRALGAAGLAVSAVLCFGADRPSMAALVWVMLLAAGAVTVTLALAWGPGVLRVFWPASRQA